MSEIVLPEGMGACVISDLHLQDEEPATLRAFLRFADALLEHPEPFALCVLGDLFEVWIGDDAQPTMASRLVAEVFNVLKASGRPVFFLRGNRDFLVGAAFCKRAGAVLLEDHAILKLDFGVSKARALLVHGDSLCTDDLAYQAFRTEVRSASWQRRFLRKPLAEREQVARELREQSEASKEKMGFSDINRDAAHALMQAHDVELLIHGHTHEGRSHLEPAIAADAQRHVTSDWHSGRKPRGDMLWLGADGTRRIRVN